MISNMTQKKNVIEVDDIIFKPEEVSSIYKRFDSDSSGWGLIVICLNGLMIETRRRNELGLNRLFERLDTVIFSDRNKIIVEVGDK